MQQSVLANTLNNREMKEKVCEERDFEYIFETYYKRVYNYIYYRINCKCSAEDLTSQVFEKVMIKIDTYSEKKSPFETWLFSIARNTVNDYFRSLKRHKFFSLDSIKELISKEKTPEEILEVSETNDKLLEALQGLNSKERNIIALKFGGSLKNKEIAEILNITETNVGVMLYRSMKKLRAEMERED